MRQLGQHRRARGAQGHTQDQARGGAGRHAAQVEDDRLGLLFRAPAPTGLRKQGCAGRAEGGAVSARRKTHQVVIYEVALSRTF